jgi:predicted N-acyltransferase
MSAAASGTAAPSLEVATSLTGVAPADWNALAHGDPFLSHAYLHALHETGCAAPSTGWTPHFLLARRGGRLVGALPLYLKSHSYGEYVFDWAWADAYARHGYEYYPKLLCAVPFTPVPGPRILSDHPDDRKLLARGALALARELGASSLHCLFPPADQAGVLEAAGLTLRKGVQFHWHNAGYADFDAFLATLNHDKRKKIRQERRRVQDAGVTFEALTGAEATDADWRFFARCYTDTYRRHGSSPYLNLDFFRAIAGALPENLVLFIGRRAGERVCASLIVRDGTRACGRYWGATEHLPGLHFEACYYQPLAYCIAQGLQTFEGGAQGEHKMARGLMPVETRSAHWLARPEFARAVDEFLARERRGVALYLDELEERSPFRRPESGA